MTNHNKTDIPLKVLDKIYIEANRAGKDEYIFNYRKKVYRIEWRKLQWSEPIRVNILKLR